MLITTAQALAGGGLIGCGWALHAWHLRDELRTARTDLLTGLPARREFLRRACAAVDPDTVVLFLDLDRFKQVNDRLGHRAGDQVLSAVGRRLRSSTATRAVCGRLDGDEFAAVLPAADDWQAGVKQLHTHLTRPVRLTDGREVAIGASIGALLLAEGPRPALSDLLATAERLMYEAKRAGGGVEAEASLPTAWRAAKPSPGGAVRQRACLAGGRTRAPGPTTDLGAR